MNPPGIAGFFIILPALKSGETNQQMSLKEQIDIQKLPRHVAIIMDGNGRWAQERGHDRLFGHLHGVESVRDVVEGAAELGIGFLTLYAFSTENWDRPADEVSGLMELLVDTIRKEVPTLNKNNIRLQVIGDTSMLPPNARRELNEAISETAVNTGLVLIMALSYSSRWEIVRAVQQIAEAVQSGTIQADQVNADMFQQHLTTHAFPDPELMIRTSGEFRISNFLLYQIAYAELYFTETLWPDFRKEDLYKAIVNYQQRERRFGKTSAQMKTQTEAKS
jgi:undecaprenyl diphosphate synthase